MNAKMISLDYRHVAVLAALYANDDPLVGAHVFGGHVDTSTVVKELSGLGLVVLDEGGCGRGGTYAITDLGIKSLLSVFE